MSEAKPQTPKCVSKELQTHAKAVQSQRFELFTRPGQNQLQPSEVLHGFCHENAVALAKHLAREGYDPEVIWGAIVDPESETPQTVPEAEAEGSVHFWVEVEVNGVSWVLDLASELPGREGELVVQKERPKVYRVLEGGRLRYAEEVTPNRLLNVEGWEWLKEIGVVRQSRIEG